MKINLNNINKTKEKKQIKVNIYNLMQWQRLDDNDNVYPSQMKSMRGNLDLDNEDSTVPVT